MALTERRKEFLAEVVRLAGLTGDPVHHGELSELLGVSAGTSYDMLRALEGAGYLERDYRLRGGGQGRSQVVYRPTDRAIALTEGSHGGLPLSPEEWKRASARLSEQVMAATESDVFEAVAILAGGVAAGDSHALVCARILGLFLVEFQELPQNGQGSVRSLLAATESPLDRLTLFVAIVHGAALSRLGEIIDFGSSLTHILGALDSLSDLDADRLAAFVEQWLATAG